MKPRPSSSSESVERITGPSVGSGKVEGEIAWYGAPLARKALTAERTCATSAGSNERSQSPCAAKSRPRQTPGPETGP